MRCTDRPRRSVSPAPPVMPAGRRAPGRPLPASTWPKYRRSTYRRPATRTSNRPDEVLRSEEHTSELQSLRHLVCRLLLEKKQQLLGSYVELLCGLEFCGGWVCWIGC